MKRLLKLVFFASLSGCSDTSNESFPSDRTSAAQRESSSAKYYKIIDGLKHDYVLYYRDVKRFGGDSTGWGMPSTDSAFEQDSITYAESYRAFFNQDTSFINWLLSFKDDTTKSGLWRMYHNPISSYISECNLGLSNSRAAVVLLENFLTGKELTCFECGYDNRLQCNLEKYREIETFLSANKEKDMAEIRTAWQRKNDR